MKRLMKRRHRKFFRYLFMIFIYTLTITSELADKSWPTVNKDKISRKQNITHATILVTMMDVVTEALVLHTKSLLILTIFYIEFCICTAEY